MSKERTVIRKSTLLMATLALAGGLTAASAQARDVTWSIGIHAPLHPGVSIGTVISNAPVYRPAPMFYAEPVYMPAPVYLQPARVVYMPQPMYAPQRVIYAPAWESSGHGQRHWRHKQRHRGEPVMVRYDR